MPATGRTVLGALGSAALLAGAPAAAQPRDLVAGTNTYVTDAFSGILIDCAYSHPTFDLALEIVGERGFDAVEIGPGHRVYTNKVLYGDMSLEIRELQNGDGYCLAYYPRATTAHTNAALDEMVGDLQVDGRTRGDIGTGTPVELAAQPGGRSVRIDGPLYGLSLHSYPVAAGGAALVLQVTGATDAVLAELGQGAPGEYAESVMTYSPTDGERTSFELTMGTYCWLDLPDFDAAVSRLRNASATIQPHEAGQLAHWSGVPISVYVESGENGVPGRCAVTSATLTLDEANLAGRVSTHVSDGVSEEIQNPDGTRTWRMNAGFWGDADGRSFTDYAFTMHSYVSGSGAGLLLETEKTQ